MAKSWQALEPGDVVDVVAPASCSTRKELKAALEFVEDFGLEPRVPRPLFGRDEICSNTDAKRWEHLKAALRAKDSKAIWCLRGGYGSNRLLPHLARLRPPAQPKLLIGYSDITALHHYINYFWGWPSVHGSMLEGLGRGEGGRRELIDMRKLYYGIEEGILFENLRPLNALARQVKVIKAPVVGGNLVVLMGLMGTPYQGDFRGKILMIEDIGERGYRVDRMLEQWRQGGMLKGIRALVFGDFVGGREDDGTFLWQEVQKRMAKLAPFPVLKGLPCGHGVHQRPLPLNTRSELRLGQAPELYVRAR